MDDKKSNTERLLTALIAEHRATGSVLRGVNLPLHPATCELQQSYDAVNELIHERKDD